MWLPPCSGAQPLRPRLPWPEPPARPGVADGGRGPHDLEIDRIAASVFSHSDLRRTIDLKQWRLPSDATDCATPTQFRTVGVYEIGPGAMAIDNPTTPIVLKPMSGSTKWCLVAAAYQDGPTDGYYNYLSMGGFVISGTPPSGSSASSAVSGADGSARQPPAR